MSSTVITGVSLDRRLIMSRLINERWAYCASSQRKWWNAATQTTFNLVQTFSVLPELIWLHGRSNTSNDDSHIAFRLISLHTLNVELMIRLLLINDQTELHKRAAQRKKLFSQNVGDWMIFSFYKVEAEVHESRRKAEPLWLLKMYYVILHEMIWMMVKVATDWRMAYNW